MTLNQVEDGWIKHVVDTLIPDKRQSSNRIQLSSDCSNLNTQLLSCILFDYLYFEKSEKYWRQLVAEKVVPDEIRILKVQFITGDNEKHHFYYLIHKRRLLDELCDTRSMEGLEFVDVNGELDEPKLITERDPVERLIQRISTHISTELKTQSDSAIIQVQFTDSIDTCVMNGWLLRYPYIYVQTQLLLDSEKCRTTRNCLGFVPLHLFKLLDDQERVVRQFTIPQALIGQEALSQLQNNLIQQFNQRIRVSLSSFETSSILL